jgi:nucleotide-binding universal stress UspA family protein
VVDINAKGVPLLSIHVADGRHTPTADFEDHRRSFLTTASEHRIETAWRAMVEIPSTGLAEMAVIADLVVCGRHHEDSSDFFALDDLVMRAGRPVLVVPPGHDELKWGHVVVAWKNTREARRALNDSLPMLTRATSVTIVHVDDDGGTTASADVIAFLAHHGIGATFRVLPPDGRRVSDQLLGFASATSTDLIVLGAFGHSRAREWIFGGVTADLMSHCPIPCLFSC